MAKKTPETNPFVQDLRINGVWKLAIEEMELGPGASGRISNATTKIIDVDNRASVFSAGLLNWFCELSTSAKDMFMYVVTHIGWETDIIEIEEEKYCQLMAIGKTTFYSTKQQLMNRLLVARVERKNTFWVNPAYVFKGDRTRKYPSKVVENNDNPLEKLRNINKRELSLFEKGMSEEPTY